jgi:hypothetical protein
MLYLSIANDELDMRPSKRYEDSQFARVIELFRNAIIDGNDYVCLEFLTDRLPE